MEKPVDWQYIMIIQVKMYSLTRPVNDDQEPSMQRRNQLEWRKYFNRRVAQARIALSSLGRSDFANVDLYRNDSLFKEAFHPQKVPSAENLQPMRLF